MGISVTNPLRMGEDKPDAAGVSGCTPTRMGESGSNCEARLHKLWVITKGLFWQEYERGVMERAEPRPRRRPTPTSLAHVSLQVSPGGTLICGGWLFSALCRLDGTVGPTWAWFGRPQVPRSFHRKQRRTDRDSSLCGARQALRYIRLTCIDLRRRFGENLGRCGHLKETIAEPA